MPDKAVLLKPTPKVFCGIEALIQRIRLLQKHSEISEFDQIVTELYKLDNALGRLRNERKYLDGSDIDAFLDRLRG
jgi:hypothetical protein